MKEITFKKADSVRVIAELASYIDSLHEGKEYTLTVKERKEKRSISANNYFWVMCDRLAEKLRMSKTDIYRSYVKEIGGNNDVVCCINKAVPALCDAWTARGLGWLAETEDSKLDGCTNVRLYYGSSTYNTETMGRLIDFLIDEAEQIGIVIPLSKERESVLNAWSLRQ